MKMKRYLANIVCFPFSKTVEHDILNLSTTPNAQVNLNTMPFGYVYRTALSPSLDSADIYIMLFSTKM